MQNPSLNKVANFLKTDLAKNVLKGAAFGLGTVGVGYAGKKAGEHTEGKKLTKAFREFNQEENQLITNSLGRQSIEAQKAVAATAYNAGQRDLIKRIQAATQQRQTA